MEKRTETKKPALSSRLRHAFSDAATQIVFGSHEKRRRQIIEEISHLPEGREALRRAEERNIPLRVVAGLDGSEGIFGRWRDGDDVSVFVRNNGSPARMAHVLAHELRHMQQFDAMGLAGDPASALSPVDIRAQLVQAMMLEADAFTAEAMFALKLDVAGRGDSLKSILSEKHEPMMTIASFIGKHPFGERTDEASYRRALFTDIMLHGISHYAASFFAQMLHCFHQASAADDLLRPPPAQGADREFAKGFTLPAEIARDYGASFMQGVSLRALSTAFIQTLPQDERKTLRMIEETARNAATMTSRAFCRNRDEIVRRCREHYHAEEEREFISSGSRRARAQTRLQKLSRSEKA